MTLEKFWLRLLLFLPHKPIFILHTHKRQETRNKKTPLPSFSPSLGPVLCVYKTKHNPTQNNTPSTVCVCVCVYTKSKWNWITPICYLCFWSRIFCSSLWWKQWFIYGGLQGELRSTSQSKGLEAPNINSYWAISRSLLAWIWEPQLNPWLSPTTSSLESSLSTTIGGKYMVSFFSFFLHLFPKLVCRVYTIHYFAWEFNNINQITKPIHHFFFSFNFDE